MGLVAVTVKAIMQGSEVLENLSSAEARKYNGKDVKSVVPSLCGTEKGQYFAAAVAKFIWEDGFIKKEVFVTDTVANVKELYPTS